MLGGAVNAVAGGGTLLTFPHVMGGPTGNRGQRHQYRGAWPVRLSSFWTYRAELHSSRREIALLAIPSFLGGILGALLLLGTDNATFAAVVPD